MTEDFIILKRRIDRAAYDLEKSLDALELAQQSSNATMQKSATVALHGHLSAMYATLAEVEQLEAVQEQLLHLIGIDATDTLFQCGICGDEWLFNPLMFKNDPNPEKRKIAYCPGKGVTHEVERV